MRTLLDDFNTAKKWYHNYQQWDEESWIEDKSVSEVIEEGIKKLQKESALLKEAVEVIEYYSNGDAYNHDYDSIREESDSSFDEEKQLSFKGKKARDFLAKLSKEGS